MAQVGNGAAEMQDPGLQDRGKDRSRPVDFVHLARYTLGNRALECEVLQLFSTQSILYLDRLRQPESDQDWRETAHALKGSALAIGAWRAAEAAQGAEALSDGAASISRTECLSEIEDAVAEANAYIASLPQEG